MKKNARALTGAPEIGVRSNTVYRFLSTKQALAALPDDVRCTLLLGGHIVNEITTLTRLLVFMSRSPEDETEKLYTGIQYLTLLRLLIGKVAEGLETFQRRVLSRPLGRKYIPAVEASPDGKEAVAKLRQFVGGNGLLRRLRVHVFHNPSDADLTVAFNALSESEPWSMMAAESRHTVAFPMSHVVVTRALLDETRTDDPVSATITMRDDTLRAADALVTFFEYLTLAVSDQHKLFPGGPRAVKDTTHLPSAIDVHIPPLCSDRKG